MKAYPWIRTLWKTDTPKSKENFGNISLQNSRSLRAKGGRNFLSAYGFSTCSKRTKAHLEKFGDFWRTGPLLKCYLVMILSWLDLAIVWRRHLANIIWSRENAVINCLVHRAFARPNPREKRRNKIVQDRCIATLSQTCKKARGRNFLSNSKTAT